LAGDHADFESRRSKLFVIGADGSKAIETRRKKFRHDCQADFSFEIEGRKIRGPSEANEASRRFYISKNRVVRSNDLL
jgi:hypothetical protein